MIYTYPSGQNHSECRRSEFLVNLLKSDVDPTLADEVQFTIQTSRFPDSQSVPRRIRVFLFFFFRLIVVCLPEIPELGLTEIPTCQHWGSEGAQPPYYNYTEIDGVPRFRYQLSPSAGGPPVYFSSGFQCDSARIHE